MIALVLGLCLGLADLDPGEAYGAYAEGRYEDAYALFDDIRTASNRPSGPLLYNLGNCAHRLGRHAEAVLLYRRARLRMPRDPEVLFNLRVAAGQLGLHDPQGESFGAALADLAASFTPREILVASILLEAIGLFGIVLFRRRRLGRNTSMLVLVVGLAGAARLVASAWFPGPPEAVVLDARVPVRAEPRAGLPVVGELEPGESVRVLERSNGWLRIRHPEARGWTPREGIGIVE